MEIREKQMETQKEQYEAQIKDLQQNVLDLKKGNGTVMQERTENQQTNNES